MKIPDNKTGKAIPPYADRFWAKVNRQDGDACWLWTAGTDADGYGRFRLDGRPRVAHVVAWELTHGRIVAGGPGKRLHHIARCPNRSCVNPAHLTIGDQADAIRARDTRGNAPAGERNAAAKLTAARVATIRAEAAAGHTTKAIAATHGVHQTVVQDIIAGRLWAHTMPRGPARRTVGRPSRAFDRNRADEMHRAGASIRDIAKALGVPRSTVAESLVRKSTGADKDSDKDLG